MVNVVFILDEYCDAENDVLDQKHGQGCVWPESVLELTYYERTQHHAEAHGGHRQKGFLYFLVELQVLESRVVSNT